MYILLYYVIYNMFGDANGLYYLTPSLFYFIIIFIQGHCVLLIHCKLVVLTYTIKKTRVVLLMEFEQILLFSFHELTKDLSLCFSTQPSEMPICFMTIGGFQI